MNLQKTERHIGGSVVCMKCCRSNVISYSQKRKHEPQETVRNLLKYANSSSNIRDLALVFDGYLYSNKNGLVVLEKKHINCYNKHAEKRNCLNFDTAFGIMTIRRCSTNNWIFSPAKVHMEIHFFF